MRTDFDLFLKDWAAKLRVESDELMSVATVYTCSPGSINRTEIRQRIQNCRNLLDESTRLLSELAGEPVSGDQHSDA